MQNLPFESANHTKNAEGFVALCTLLMILLISLSYIAFDGVSRKGAGVFPEPYKEAEPIVEIPEKSEVPAEVSGILDAEETDSEKIMNFSNASYSESPCRVTKMSSVSVYDKKSGGTFSMPLDEYTALCVFAEMPTNYDAEALRAQAVACRTLAVYKHFSTSSPSHNGADICTDPAHCQSFVSKDDIAAKYGDAGIAAYEKAKDASNATSGIIMLYESEPILAAFHSSSGAHTASSAEVWGGKVDYLVSVESGEINEESLGATTYREYSKDEFFSRFEKIGVVFDKSQKEKDLGSLFTFSYLPSGRVESVSGSGVTVTSKNVAGLFGLISTDFSFGEKDGKVVISCRGYGHGVGMSQKGAQYLAKQGYDFYDILSHYYKGISFGFVG